MHSNHLIHETSPYLLQHAHNPVDWYPWSEEALQRARVENKPILVSIGYSACHWCHVMERESFEDETTAKIMNDNFINIKVDREERPDLDHIYMDAVQAMTGSGGWPLNVFLTPDKKPFYGGTYFPPARAFNRASWKEVLAGVFNAFEKKRNEIDSQAETLTQHLLQANDFGFHTVTGDIKNEWLKAQTLDEAFNNCMKIADRTWGGFGKAPKFPQTFVILFLLRHHFFTKNPDALQQAMLSLDKMIEGGIYDQLGGGFARYSTDTEWLAPHFEKMLYDNALLVNVLSEAYQLSKKERHKEVIGETIAFISREMMNDQGGFYSALDADSEGEEGKYYVWDYPTVEKLLDGQAPFFCDYYDITVRGNWEGKNILRVKKPLEWWACKIPEDVSALKKKVEKGRTILLEARVKRVRPALDDKIILGWNALMNTALSKAFAATGIAEFKRLAILNMSFLLEKFSTKDSTGFFHTWKREEAKYPAFLDDYAFLVDSLVHLHEITADKKWLFKAKELTGYIIEHFSDDESCFFFFTGKNQKDVIVRKKEVYDGAVPSGNSIMAYNLYRLGIFFDEENWKRRAQQMTVRLGKTIINHPSSFGMWTCLCQEMIQTTNEIVILGEAFQQLLDEVLLAYIPNKILMGSRESDFYYPLMMGKGSKDSTMIYLCKDFSCRQPVLTSRALLEQIAWQSGAN
jgi:uncharacterized protein YyaL (SSP411 family)